MKNLFFKSIKRLLLIFIIIILLLPLFSYALIIDNYIAGWKLDSATLDITGNFQMDNLNVSNGELFNGSSMIFVTNGTCKINQCYLFLGINTQPNRIRVNHTFPLESLANLQAGTISLWSKTETNYAGAFIGQPINIGWSSPYVSIGAGVNNSLGITSGSGDWYIANNSAQINVVAYTQPSKNVWHLYTYTFNLSANNMSVYIDGVLINSSTMQYRKANNSWAWSIGALRWDSSQFGTSYQGYVDDVNIWQRDLKPAEILKIYNNNMTYPFEEPISNLSYNITLIQEPSDINSSTLYMNVSAILNSSNSNMSNLTKSYVTYYSKIYTSLNNGCSVFYQSVCIQNSSIFVFKNMTQINNTNYYTIVNDNELFPAYYPFNYTKINNMQGWNYTAYNNNNIKFKILNFSTISNYTFLTVEMDAVNMSSLTASMIVYYCNSSYNSGNPLTDVNCEVISVYLPQLWSHIHNQSRHGVIQFQVNNITKTQTSYIIFVSPNLLQANGWRFRYINDTSYNNDSFQIGNFNLWSNTSNIFDIHLHQYLPTDYYRYYAIFTDDIENFKQSSTVTDYYNITQYLPTIPLILTPNCSQKFTKDITGTFNNSINFSWTKSSDANNDAITYYMNFTFASQEYKVCNTTNNITWCLSPYGTNQLNAGIYYMKIYSCDYVTCSVSDSSCSFNVCLNSWNKSVQPCINNLKVISYYDLNSCNEAYNIPSDNNTYENCVVQATQGETDIVNALYAIVLCAIIGLLIYLYKRGD